MQTLSLKTSQSVQKNLTDVVSKSESNVNNVASDAEKTPFQMELTKQVQEKKQLSQPGQARPVPIHNKVVQNAQAPKRLAPTQQEMTSQDSAEPAADKVAHLGASGIPSGLLATDKSGDAKLPLEIREQKETKSEDLVVNADSSALALVAPGLMASGMMMSSTTPALVASQNATHLPDGDTGLVPLTTSDGAVPKQQSLDVMLGNALSQAKSPNIMEKEVVDSAVTKTPIDNVLTKAPVDIDSVATKAPDQASRISNILDNASTRAAREDVAANKTILNVMNDMANKENSAIGTTAAIQPQVAQVNNTLAAQQPGSANTISAYPGKTGWDQAISQKVVWMVGTGEQTASLTLNPPDLGPLKVVIHVHNDQADTTFISDNDEVRQALENGLSNLRDKMSESGIPLGQANISTSSQSQQSFQQATQNRSLGRTQGNASPQAEAAANARATVRVVNGLVDTFA